MAMESILPKKAARHRHGRRERGVFMPVKILTVFLCVRVENLVRVAAIKPAKNQTPDL
jgi:hypothetical protein